jgi:heavy metal sensor kinase
VSSEQTGRLRVYARPIVRDGREIGVFRAANPLTAVEEAQEGLRNTFLVVGLVALAVAVAVAAWIAGLLTRPLRRIAAFASAVDAGDLTRRVEGIGGSREARVVATSFNHMLDRVEHAFRRQRQFVADASHELRTPLTVLRGEMELLRANRGAAPQDRERAEKLLREVDRMERLVADMLTLAAADSGGLAVSRVDLDDFFSDLERDLPLFGEREYRVTPAPGELDADPDRLTQVLRNLIRNAVAHTDQGDRITVAASAENGHIEFAVSDEGQGIPTEHLDRLFDRFYRVDGGRASDEGGSGLGLAIAKAIVEAHGGRIWAESEPGGGATIRFALPGYRSP